MILAEKWPGEMHDSDYVILTGLIIIVLLIGPLVMRWIKNSRRK